MCNFKSNSIYSNKQYNNYSYKRLLIISYFNYTNVLKFILLFDKRFILTDKIEGQCVDCLNSNQHCILSEQGKPVCITFNNVKNG